MGKLVRDKIPAIIRQSGRTPRVTRLPTDAYRSALMDKLHEEVAELTAAQTTQSMLEEAGDVLEVLAAIAADHGAALESIFEAARKKRAQRGGFTRRLARRRRYGRARAAGLTAQQSSEGVPVRFSVEAKTPKQPGKGQGHLLPADEHEADRRDVDPLC